MTEKCTFIGCEFEGLGKDTVQAQEVVLLHMNATDVAERIKYVIDDQKKANVNRMAKKNEYIQMGLSIQQTASLVRSGL